MIWAVKPRNPIGTTSLEKEKQSSLHSRSVFVGCLPPRSTGLGQVTFQNHFHTVILGSWEGKLKGLKSKSQRVCEDRKLTT